MFEFPITFEMIFWILQLLCLCVILGVAGYVIIRFVIKVLMKYGKKDDSEALEGLEAVKE